MHVVFFLFFQRLGWLSSGYQWLSSLSWSLLVLLVVKNVKNYLNGLHRKVSVFIIYLCNFKAWFSVNTYRLGGWTDSKVKPRNNSQSTFPGILCTLCPLFFFLTETFWSVMTTCLVAVRWLVMKCCMSVLSTESHVKERKFRKTYQYLGHI